MEEFDSEDEMVVAGGRNKKRRTLADSEDEELSRMEEEIHEGKSDIKQDNDDVNSEFFEEDDNGESMEEDDKSDESFSEKNDEDEDFDSPISEEDDDDDDWTIAVKKKKIAPTRQSSRSRKSVSYSYNDDAFEEDIENYENASSRRKKAKLENFEGSDAEESSQSPKRQRKRLQSVQSVLRKARPKKAPKFSESDEDEPDEEDDEEDDMDEDGVTKEEYFGPRIDKLFDFRDGVNGQEWLVKWKGVSHLHLEWVITDQILDIPGAKQRMRNLERNPPDRSLPYFNEDYKVVDRVLADRNSENGLEYLVKWKMLPYSESTWESVDVIPENEVQLYIERNTYPDDSYFRKVSLNKDPNPPTFKDDMKLRDYQLAGFRFLLYSCRKNRNVILGDEMGLGKTIQSIALLYYLFSVEKMWGPFLVVAPLVTLEQWRREIEGWTKMNCVIYHGSAADRQMIVEHEFKYGDNSKIFKFNILVTTYEYVLQESALLSMINWQYLVLDEGHRIKNQQSKVLQSLNQIHATRIIILTGTPLQNNILELWTMLNFLDPETFPSREAFVREYEDMTAAKVAQLKEIMSPYLLRRLKKDVEQSLPLKEEKIIEVELTSVQKQYYRAILDRNREFLLRGVKKKTSCPSLNNIMMELRKCCNHPFLIQGAEEKISGHLLSHSSSKENLIFTSAKLVLLDKLLKKLREEKRQVLIFSQMIMVLDLLEEYLRYRNYPFERLDGSKNKDDRVAAIDRFTKEDDQFVFLLSTRAGGLGLNLTRADTVVIFDSDWNPHNDSQAMARAHRIGQTQNVVVYRLVTKATYEQRMLEIAGKKMALDTAVLGSSKSGNSKNKLGGLNATQIDELLRYGAYHVFNGNEDEEQADRLMQEENIDAILQRCSTVVHKEEGESENAISKVSFSVSEKDRGIDFNDENFWEKVLPEFKTLDSLKQDLAEGKINTMDEQKNFMKHLETLVNDMILQMKDQGSRFSDIQAKTELILFLKRVNESPIFSDKFRTKALIHTSALDIGKRSRLQSSERVDAEKGKARTSSSSASKEKLLKTFQKERSQDEDDDFDDDDTEEESFDPKSRRDGSGWLSSHIKKLKKFMFKFGMNDIGDVYNRAILLKKTKSMEQLREMRYCVYYQTLETATSNGISDLDKHYQFLKKSISMDSALIEDFKSLKFGFTNSVTRKKEGSIAIVNSNGTSVFGPGDSIQVEVTLGETVFEPQVAVYFEIVGIHLNFGPNAKQIRTLFYRLDDSTARSATLVIHAPGCPGEYLMKCVKMWSKEEKDYTHFVCSEPLSFTVQCSESIKEIVPNTTRGTNQFLQRIAFMRNLQVFIHDDLSVKLTSPLPIWWWSEDDDRRLLEGLLRYGFDEFDNIENDPDFGFTVDALSVRLKSKWNQLSNAEKDRILKGPPAPGPLGDYATPPLKNIRSKLNKRAQSLIEKALGSEIVVRSSAAKAKDNSKPEPKKKAKSTPKKTSVKKEKVVSKKKSAKKGKEESKVTNGKRKREDSNSSVKKRRK